MPTLRQLEENSVPVVLTRGGIAITCQALVERISWSNPQFVANQNKAQELADERALLVAKHRPLVMAFQLARAAYEDPEFLQREFQPVEEAKPRARKGKAEETEPFVNFGERAQKIQAAIDEAEANLKAATDERQKELDAIDARSFSHSCVRVAFLLKAWDLFEDEEGTKMIPITAESIEAIFADKKEFVTGWPVQRGEIVQLEGGLLDLIEAATFGPLVNPSDSTA